MVIMVGCGIRWFLVNEDYEGNQKTSSSSSYKDLTWIREFLKVITKRINSVIKREIARTKKNKKNKHLIN